MKRGTELDVDQSIWTALPSEKQSQLEPLPTHPSKQKQQVNPTKRTGKSLVDLHKEGTFKSVNSKGEDISFKRYDRERDIVGVQMDLAKKRRIMKEAGDLSSKFSAGSS